MSIIGIVSADKMRRRDDNRITIYVVPDVWWAEEQEWREFLAADHEDRQRIKERWHRRSVVLFSRFEVLARSGCVSLADYPPSDATIRMNAGQQNRFESAVDAAIAAVYALPVSRQYGRETRLGIPHATRFWSTRYLGTHAEIIEWAKLCLSE